MRARERLIRESFSERVCGHCGSRYGPDSVLVLARRHSFWMVMATCTTCQQRHLFVVSFDEEHSLAENRLLPSDLPSPLLPPQPAVSLLPITSSDVYSIREFLATFSGDFKSLFSPPRIQRADDTPSS